MITDFETWYRDVGSDRLFRFLIYRRMFTPYEWEEKFMDDTEFDSVHYTFGYIEEAIDLGHGEWLLGIREVFPDEEEHVGDTVTYYRLSEIRLAFRKEDAPGEEDFAWEDGREP